MENKIQQITTLSTSAILSHSLLKASHLKTDPYTRAAIGITVGAGLFLSSNPIVRYAGIGIAIAGALQITDVFKGGRLAINEAKSQVYVLHETKGIIELKNREVPEYNIDGFTCKGLNGVFKLSDGVYAEINFKNEINVLGIGAFVNTMRRAGFKLKKWTDLQADKRWVQLYNLSV
ncbi:MAG: hypothetical protein JST67_08215 [Bacteroidetes bacterium]|nr:hypothetical protein [Bacteroidota bacterium]